MKISKQKYCWCIIITLIVCMGVLLFIGAPVLNKMFIHSDKLKTINLYASVIYVNVISIWLMVNVLLSNGVGNLLSRIKIHKAIEKNLISIGAYEAVEDKIYVKLPKIKVTNDKIIITYPNIYIREIIDRYIEIISTGLPNSYIVEEWYISKDNNDLIIKYENLDKYEPEKYSLLEYKHMIDKLDMSDIYFDRKHIVSLKDYQHWLLSGMTGSGKSYLAQQILMQCIFKGFEVVVLDMKHSYGMFKNYVNCYCYEPEEILENLRAIETEMHFRIKELQATMDDNPKATATDIGYKRKIVIVEEYIALQTAMDKKQKAELEDIVKSISVMSRVADIHLIIVMQSAGTENIQASTRHNLTKILLGFCQSNIYTATFGTGIEIPNANVQKSRGEGLIQLDKISILRVPEITDMQNLKNFKNDGGNL